MDPHAHQPRPSKGHILASAKVVADAAKATISHDRAGVDKGKVAGAAADLLTAVANRGKSDGQGAGKYAVKAEGFLRTYQSSHQSVPAPGSHAASPQPGGAASGGSHGHGDYLKVAQGLLGSHSGGAQGAHSSTGGYGDYAKMAGGLLKKH